MSTELYKRFRPRTLDKVMGNEQTVLSLKNMLERKTLPHFILFTGPSGCGKTTLARILKDELECHDLDFKEVNSSSFRGIDTIRDIQRNMMLAPAGACRIWLLDEVHMLSKDAQNAALKMLEDTPQHVYFFLATTDPDKLITAIRTRACEMPVRLLTDQEAEALLSKVCKKAAIQLPRATEGAIVEAAEGSPRSLLVMLDKVTNLAEDQQAAAIEAVKAEQSEAYDLCKALISKKPWGAVAKILKDLKGEPEQVRRNVLGYARGCLLRDNTFQAYNVLLAFEKNFYDSGNAGLMRACYEAIYLGDK